MHGLVRLLYKEYLIHYQNNGCSSLKFGLESGSQTMLDVMEKKFTVEDIKKAIIHNPKKIYEKNKTSKYKLVQQTNFYIKKVKHKPDQ